MSDDEDEMPRKPKVPLLQRLRNRDPELIRLDLTASLFRDELTTDEEKNELIRLLPYNKTIETVHLSGSDLHLQLTYDQIHGLVRAVGDITSMEDLGVFRGGCPDFNEDLLAALLSRPKNKLRVLMMWSFMKMGESLNLAQALRQHATLERLTITLPSHAMQWACLDVIAMAVASTPNLKVLQIRCQSNSSARRPQLKQEESLISPEAFAILIQSQTIHSLYLENCGLIDDHTDLLAEMLAFNKNKTLRLLDLKNNCFTDDALYTIGRALPKAKYLRSIDLSGTPLSEGGGTAMAEGMSHNIVITHLELEGTAERFIDEFDIPVGHENTAWMQQIYYHVRLNRANIHGDITTSREHYVEALNLVSDQLDCLFFFLRSHPQYCNLDYVPPQKPQQPDFNQENQES